MSTPEIVREKTLIERFGKSIIERIYLEDGKEQTFLLWGGKVTPVAVFAVTNDNKVIAIETFRRAANQTIIELPGGNPNPGEDATACGLRELKEETGFVAGKIIALGPPVWFDPASCFTQFVPILALGCQKAAEQRLEETEEAEGMEVVLFDVEEWITMIHSGEIRDAKSMAITFLALPYLSS